MPTLLKKLTRRGARIGAYCPGFTPLMRAWRARSIAIVMYHGVTAAPLPTFNWCQLDREAFAQQIEFLASRYRILPLAEVVDALDRKLSLPAHTAVITFDDGYRNVLTEAAPILERHSAPATVYLVTGLMEDGQPPWPQRLYHALVCSTRNEVVCEDRRWTLTDMTQRGRACQELAAHLKTLDEGRKEERLAEIFAQLGDSGCVADDSPLATVRWPEVESAARSGLLDFGSHTHTHPILSRCSATQQEQELRLSRDIIREHLGRCDLFAYPNGSRADFTDQTKTIARQLGYRSAVTTEPGLSHAGEDRLAMRRVLVGADTSFATFELEMAGL